MIKINDVVSKYTPFLASFAAGMILMYFVYPSKRIEETITQKYEKIIEENKIFNQLKTDDVTKTKDKIITEFTTTVSSYKSQINEMSSKISEMSSHKVEVITKVQRPDGTIEEKSYIESNETSIQKVTSELKASYDANIQKTNSKWEKTLEQEKIKITQQYQEQISRYEQEKSESEKKKITEVNPKKLGIEVGARTDKSVYIHGTYDILGPVFIGTEVQKSLYAPDISAGMGIGIRI